MAKKKKYDWGDGKKVHSISAATHNANVEGVKSYGVTPGTSLTAPLDSGTAYKIAQAAAGQKYDPEIQANQQLQRNTPVWYQNYIDQTGKQQAAAQAYAQPTLDTAQAAVGNAGATAPGLDPSSPQYAAEQQAAAGRKTMAQDSANYLAGVAAATNAYFGGQANVAQRELPQVQAGLTSQYGQLQGAKNQAATDAYGTIRTNEQNADIARQTLGLNTANTIADNMQNAADSAQSASDKRAARVVSRKNTRDRITAQTKSQQAAADKTAAKEQDKQNAAKTKTHAAVQKATGAIQSKVADAKDAWERYARATNTVTDPVTKKTTTVKATPDQIKSRLRKDGYSEAEIHVMLMLRAGKPLTPSDIQRLKNQDPNFRVPNEWRAAKPKSAAGGGATAAPKNDRSGMGSRPT